MDTSVSRCIDVGRFQLSVPVSEISFGQLQACEPLGGSRLAIEGSTRIIVGSISPEWTWPRRGRLVSYSKRHPSRGNSRLQKAYGIAQHIAFTFQRYDICYKLFEVQASRAFLQFPQDGAEKLQTDKARS